jgi:hypothetical protein
VSHDGDAVRAECAALCREYAAKWRAILDAPGYPKEPSEVVEQRRRTAAERALAGEDLAKMIEEGGKR